MRLFSFKEMSLLRGSLFGFTQALGHFGLWTLAFALPAALDDARVRALEADKLRLEADQLRAAAELARLRAQLEPHFLLNTLNAIAGLVTEDSSEARRLLVCLGDLLRDSLHDADELQTLDAQLAWLKRYAEILESRHRGALAFSWEVDPGVDAVLVPRLLLQPLRRERGQARRAAPARRRRGHRPRFEAARRRPTRDVHGRGQRPGPRRREPRAGAFGLQSVRRRLELQVTRAPRFRIESSTEGHALDRRAAARASPAARRRMSDGLTRLRASSWSKTSGPRATTSSSCSRRRSSPRSWARSRRSTKPRTRSALGGRRRGRRRRSSTCSSRATASAPASSSFAQLLAARPDAPLFVLATAFEQHALEAFELGVVDYLLKPFTEERVMQCLKRLHARSPRPAAAAPARRGSSRGARRASCSSIPARSGRSRRPTG